MPGNLVIDPDAAFLNGVAHRFSLSLATLVMHRTLGTLKHAFVRGEGVVEVPFFVFGRLSGGPLVGLQSIAIET